MPDQKVSMDELTALCKSRGFIFPGSEIYGGLANSWDYGPLGVELANNIKKAFWEFFVYGREDIVGIDAAILMNPKVWEASGHVGSFSDPLIDCKKCKTRHRADKLLFEWVKAHLNDLLNDKTPTTMSTTEAKFLMQNLVDFKKGEAKSLDGVNLSILYKAIKDMGVECPDCSAKDFSEARNFNLMFKTKQGVIEDEGADIYLRPETAQGIFVNFVNVQRTTRKKLPFGIAQIGKAFRNEITPGNFIFRTREFEQMEIEYFFDPEKDDWRNVWEGWKSSVVEFVTKTLGINSENVRMHDHSKEELSHYSKGTTDIEYNFPFGWSELCAAGAYRTAYDLTQHQNFSGENMEYRDEESGRKFIPHVIEPSIGVGRPLLAILLDAYTREKVASDKLQAEGDSAKVDSQEERVVMKFLPRIAPVKVAVFPLMKKDGLPEKAREVIQQLRSLGNVEYDETGSVGKRYRRHDEIGTPACVTIDYDSLKDESVTVRDRDSMQQERVKISELLEFLRERYCL
ncbi:glycine--tRNA ligase [Candidatus Peregrinibacteria bacterium]|nr:glycine--tRNA ligase [Candidatus Peregrinibacteria bacterium]